MEGFLICFIFKLIRRGIQGILHLFEMGVCGLILRKFQNDKKIEEECEAYYSNTRDIFGEEW